MPAKSSKELKGLRFGRWLAIEKVSGPGRSAWLCRCTCGVERTVREKELASGRSQSCGCLAAEKSSQRNATHGRSKSGAFKSWSAMIQRCSDPSTTAYGRYGARGITVCNRWLIFENFYADMGERPEGKSIDRYPDKEGNYEPGNCRWASAKEQQRNRGVTHTLTIGGVTKPLQEWCEKAGLPYHVVVRRKYRGWPDEECLRPRRTK